MDLQNAIEAGFSNYIKTTFTDENIRSFLLKHERRHKLLENLKCQIDKAEHILLPSNKSLEEKRKIIQGIVNDFTYYFCKIAIEVKKAEIEKTTKTTIEEAFHGKEKESWRETDTL